MKPWQALLNKAPSKGGKEEQRERTQVPAGSLKPEGGSQMGKGTKYVPEFPGVLRSKLEEEMKGKPESTVNLEEPSPGVQRKSGRTVSSHVGLGFEDWREANDMFIFCTAKKMIKIGLKLHLAAACTPGLMLDSRQNLIRLVQTQLLDQDSFLIN